MLEIYFILGKHKETFEKDEGSFLDSSMDQLLVRIIAVTSS
jgi:hypothetical protein